MLHQQNEIVAERYQIITALSEGDKKSTYTAFDLRNLQPVVVKVFSRCKVTDQKTLKLLLEREIKTLSSLDYPSIPKYVDYFEIDAGEEHRFYLVRELVAGKSLAKLVADGWNPSETELKGLIIQLLNTLTYLHSRSPFEIHRNIKPENIILSQSDRVCLVDSGTTEDILRWFEPPNMILDDSLEAYLASIHMSTEQMMGRAAPASDLYSMGYCLIFLLSCKSPTELLRFSREFDRAIPVNISPNFKEWLKKMVAEKEEDRFNSAAAALEAIPRELKVTNLKLVPNKATKKIEIDRQQNYLIYRIFLGYHNFADGLKSFSRIGILALAIASLFIVPELAGFSGTFVWLFYLASGNDKPRFRKLTPSPFNVAQKYIALEINSQTFCLEKTTGVGIRGEVKINRKIGKTSDIRWINSLGEQNDSVIIATRSNNREHQYAFGDRLLSQEEATAIVEGIQKFIKNAS